jgi:hypothetical protein
MFPLLFSLTSGVVNIIGPIVALVIFFIIGACILYRRRHRHQRIKLSTHRLDPFRQSTSGAREISSPTLWNHARPSLLSNFKTHFSSPARSSCAVNHFNSSSEESSKPPTYMPMSRYGQFPAKTWHRLTLHLQQFFLLNLLLVTFGNSTPLHHAAPLGSISELIAIA